MDPRVTATANDLRVQYDASRTIDAALRGITSALQSARGDRTVLTRLQRELTQLFTTVEQADGIPSSQVLAAVKTTVAAATAATP